MSEEKVYGRDEIVGAINEFLEEHLNKITTGPREGFYTAEGTDFFGITVIMHKHEVPLDTVRQTITIELEKLKLDGIIKKSFKLNFPISVVTVIHTNFHHYFLASEDGYFSVPAYKVYIRAEIYDREPRIFITDR